MIAQIKYDDIEYFSHIYFICRHEYRTKAIVFNTNINKFEFIDGYQNKYTSERIIYLFDFSEVGYVKKKKMNLGELEITDCMGYPWLMNNKELINDIIGGKDISNEYIELAMNDSKNIDVYAWHDVKNQEDIDELLDISGAFHDSYIRDFKGIFGRPYEPEFVTKFQISFELYGNHFDLMMEFSDGVIVNFSFYKYLNSIYLSSLFFHENRIYWLEGNDELGPVDIKDNSHISAGSLRWKIIPKIKNEEVE